MTSGEAKRKLKRLRNRYLMIRYTELVFLGFALFFIALSLFYVLKVKTPFQYVSATLLGLVLMTERIFSFGLLKLNDLSFIRFINAQHPQLEESADLLVADRDKLSRLEYIQLKKVIQRFETLYPAIKFPTNLPRAIATLAFGIFLYVILTSFISFDNVFLSTNEPVSKQTARNEANIFLRSFSASITPPAYTTLKSFESTTSDLRIPEGSSIKWVAEFNDTIKNASVVISNRDTLALLKGNRNYEVKSIITESGFYQLHWHDYQKSSSSDYYKIEVIKDQPPSVVIDNLTQFTKLSFSKNMKVAVESTLADDYGLTGSTLVATVSKGSGESVKFREEKFSFEKPSTISGKQVKASLMLDLNKMGLEPGDELYFYVEAIDNKAPQANHNRTETFFIALQDTTKQVAVEDEGLGVDLMPEYFRSQRQIIIDTEKLLKEKKKHTQQHFKSGSNELAYDQKVLRLRYGQFLGEEFEDQIGKAPSQDDHESTEDISKQFGHNHDKDNEHNLVPDKKPMDNHSQHGKEGSQSEKENPIEEFAHNHDNSDQATFFVQSVRAKLKAALTVMWDAELQLRLYEPEKSLPYQYTALKLLKEISNDSRIYVHRTGFDPPPLKEDKRLTADLSEIHDTKDIQKKTQIENFSEIKNAFILIESLLVKGNFTLSTSNKEQLNRAGSEVAREALKQPGKYLECLSLLKQVTEQPLGSQRTVALLKTIRGIFWELLPTRPSVPSKGQSSTHSLDQAFVDRMKQLND